jgi:hypothetical protein
MASLGLWLVVEEVAEEVDSSVLACPIKELPEQLVLPMVVTVKVKVAVTEQVAVVAVVVR